ncbi:NAD-dependent protein deacetylase [Sulfolobus acidocaldarius]|uniref:NAD-dependent protein deacetylase n=5 Tax=Sulfolobus acidocaldarius TaxID=2285 RepID=NPD_SULAC|nr:NAD-dependent protein deacetylase [Sulfolobus acidocaldarius]Q4JBN2.2 RecName: Full=NAD-dependent protein deacetylase; AltName: Full=Regulatory protein SIR2 homolog [Sulfolobus acidocaldarius DSM 639]ALU29246.1 NAD-dependent deacetylase [Sulfolobus acidocaldarius]ALU31975.1 NAD-dependent deacetylase [Sulfolobus acidocaldarius]
MYLVEEAKKVAEMILSSVNAIAFTGAGISTASGIPDFRGPQGLWKKYSPELASIEYFQKYPDAFWQFYSTRMKSLFEAKPNRAHYALAQLEKMGLIKAVITQNVDGLHSVAGSRNVIELHGNMRKSYCTSCLRSYDSLEVLARVEKGEVIPRCECGGILKPDVVLFGEPVHGIYEAMRIANESDLVLAIGSSLTVYPANQIPLIVKRNGGGLIILNGEETPYDEYADLVIRERIEIFLPEVISHIQSLHRSS